MRIFKLISVFGLMLNSYLNCSAQIPRNDLIAYYKLIFFYRCTEPFVIDTGFRDEVCTCCPEWMDDRSLIEIDSMSTIIGDEIRLDVESINVESSGNFYPSRECVLHYCLNQYDSKNMNKMAKGFARRMKKVNPINYSKY